MVQTHKYIDNLSSISNEFNIFDLNQLKVNWLKWKSAHSQHILHDQRIPDPKTQNSFKET